MHFCQVYLKMIYTDQTVTAFLTLNVSNHILTFNIIYS